MLDIKQEDVFELVDVGHEEIEAKFETLSDIVFSQTPILGICTGIGSTRKFAAGGIPWILLKKVAFDLIDKGLIKVIKCDDYTKVDTSGLESIEVSFTFTTNIDNSSSSLLRTSNICNNLSTPKKE